MANPYSLGLDLNVGMKLEQRLSPQMIQSLKLLQVTALQLETMVNQELEINPMLEQEDDIKEEEKSDSRTDTEKSPESEKETSDEEFKELKSSQEEEDVNWESFFEDGFDPGFRRTEEKIQNDDRLERLPVSIQSLQDQLQEQLIYKHIKPQIRPLVEYIINSLNEDGYLVNPVLSENEMLPEVEESVEIQEIQAIIAGEVEEIKSSRNVREAFNLVRSLDPPGIGAKSLQECLLIQINRGANCSPLAKILVEKEFSMVEKVKISAIAKKLERSPEEIQSAIREIGKLEPKPGRLLTQTVSTSIIPDLILEVIDGEIILITNDKYVPSLRISRNYSSLLKRGSSAKPDEKKYVRDKLNSASWLIRAIEQRKSTMLKVMHAIIESQPDFFIKGLSFLKPLILQDIADKIEMHISTVSRVINGKYVQTPQGIFELKYFFTSSLAQEDGKDVSSMTIKNEIRSLIESEDSQKPLSDQKLSNILQSKKLDVARRTVAKYRDQLEILPARLRKQF